MDCINDNSIILYGIYNLLVYSVMKSLFIRFPPNHRVLEVFLWQKTRDCIKQIQNVGTPVLLALLVTAPPQRLCWSQKKILA